MMYVYLAAVQNERDRISCRRPSYDESSQNNGLSVSSLLNAEMLSRQVGAALEVSAIGERAEWNTWDERSASFIENVNYKKDRSFERIWVKDAGRFRLIFHICMRRSCDGNSCWLSRGNDKLLVWYFNNFSRRKRDRRPILFFPLYHHCKRALDRRRCLENG